MNEFFILYPNCIPVKGANRSTICDLQYNRIRLIPNLFFDVLKLLKSMGIKEVKEFYNSEMNEGIDKYLQLLEREDYGFRTLEPERFPEFNLEWETPSVITNAIIDVSTNSSHPFERIAKELHQLGCTALQIRAYEIIDREDLNVILSTFANSRINSFELLLAHDNWSSIDLSEMLRSHRRIRSIVFHSCDQAKSEYLQDWDVKVVYIRTHVESESHCGAITSNNFVSNVKLFTESLKFNSCLNRKISIDRFGNIKNCPTMTKSYGNISNTSLISVIENAEFSNYWTIIKDEIIACRDCEFRYVCTDCRAVIKDTNNIYSKPSKCKYDPYTATWDSIVK